MKCVLILIVSLMAVLGGVEPAAAGTLDVKVCGTWSHDAGPLQTNVRAPFVATATCGPGGRGLDVNYPGGYAIANNASAGWETTAPQGITITHIHLVGAQSINIGNGHGWWGEFYWNGGPGPDGRSDQINTNNFALYGCCQANFNNQHVGWFIACAASQCSTDADLSLYELDLTAQETRGPTVVAQGSNHLWYQHGWVRGTWPVSLWASDPSGVCGMALGLGSQLLYGPGATPNQDAWHQCPDQTWSKEVDTRASQGSLGLGEGAMPLVLSATNAAGVATSPSETVYVDNQAPSVTLSGPSDASSSAGVQYVTATASAGPSGVSGVSCSLDGGSYQYEAGASAQVPVQGVGSHTVTCVASNNARGADGSFGTSAPGSWTMTIRKPTVFGIGFSRVVNALRCHRVLERVKVPGKWVVVHRHHKLVQVRRPARTKLVSATRCHPRTVERRVSVWSTVRQQGKLVRVKTTKIVRVVVPPRVVNDAARRVHFGRGTTVSGWLGASDGTALGGQTVHVLTAPDNGEGTFRQSSVVTTRSDGSWSARLPAGPGRLVEALYGGDPLTEPTVSAQVRVIVPAKVRLTITPTVTHWRGTIQLSGRVLGGYIPAGKLLRLRIGVQGVRGTVGIPDLTPTGRFHTTWTFAPGNGTVHYWFSVSTLAEADYPYAPASSGRVTVTVDP